MFGFMTTDVPAHVQTVWRLQREIQRRRVYSDIDILDSDMFGEMMRTRVQEFTSN